jgi:hypothetical protein
MNFIFDSKPKRRFFVVTQVFKSGNKETKGVNTVLSGARVRSAAKKALTKLCKIKRYRGRCTLKVTLVEVEPNESGKDARLVDGNVVKKVQKGDGLVKSYTYKMKLVKLKEPTTVMLDGVPVTYKYESVITSVGGA